MQWYKTKCVVEPCPNALHPSGIRSYTEGNVSAFRQDSIAETKLRSSYKKLLPLLEQVVTD
jgi:hypothetical protein